MIGVKTPADTTERFRWNSITSSFRTDVWGPRPMGRGGGGGGGGGGLWWGGLWGKGG